MVPDNRSAMTMNIDFSKLGGTDASDTITEPRDLFNVLPGKTRSRYPYPRDVQAEVWSQWYARRNERDLTIKMNTGGGKTVVGLVLLKSCLNEGLGPAAYIAPSPPLVQQVLAEAKGLGIETTEDAKSTRFASGKSVLVANIYKLINGRSVFGVGDNGIQIRIGSVVIDDAHACLAASEENFTIKLKSGQAAYTGLMELILPELERQSPSGALEVKDGDPVKSMVVPYWTWIDKQQQILSALHAERETSALMFSYPLLKDRMAQCQCAVGAGEIEISCRCLPIDLIPSFGAAKRRIFMGATLGDDSILITHFDADPHSVSKPIVPSTSSDIGDRIILIPQELNPDVTDEELKRYFQARSTGTNVVVLVPSEHRAKFWADVAIETLRSDTITAGAERLRSGHVGLVVLVNKYDGIDLPENACRILVLDGLPDVRGRLDKIEQGMLMGSAEAIRDSMQRIEQGMGRGIRSNDDYCAVFLMGRTLTSQLYAPDAMSFFTPATRAQLELSKRLANQMVQPTIEQMDDVVSCFMKREDGWVRASKAAVVGTKHQDYAEIRQIALSQRRSFNAASQRDFRRACEALQVAIDAEQTERVKGWLLWQLAEQQHQLDAAKSQETLRAAVRLNPQVVRPLDGIEYVRIPGQTLSQGALCIDWLRKTYSDGNRLLVDMNGILDVLVFATETAGKFERALAQIAKMLGFSSQQPEQDFGRGPDVLWSLGPQKYLVIECKNGATADSISKGYCNQLAGSMNWFNEKYGATFDATPILIHPAKGVEFAATMPPDARVMCADQLSSFRDAMRNFVTGLAAKPNFGDVRELTAALQHHRLTADQFVAAFTVSPRTRV